MVLLLERRKNWLNIIKQRPWIYLQSSCACCGILFLYHTACRFESAPKSLRDTALLCRYVVQPWQDICVVSCPSKLLLDSCTWTYSVRLQPSSDFKKKPKEIKSEELLRWYRTVETNEPPMTRHVLFAFSCSGQCLLQWEHQGMAAKWIHHPNGQY